jgi:hypothetical protein
LSLVGGAVAGVGGHKSLRLAVTRPGPGPVVWARIWVVGEPEESWIGHESDDVMAPGGQLFGDEA